MKTLELKIIPPLLAFMIAGFMKLATSILPGFFFENLGWIAVQIPASIALFLVLSAFYSLKKVKTTANPRMPERTEVLVTSGIFRYTRNPMYLSLLFLLVAWAFWLSNFAAFPFLPVFIVYITRFQIMPEERELSRKFGESYQDYLNCVGRWLPLV